MRMLVFRSDLFKPYLPDDCQVNPNVLGFELAHWLSRELAARGSVTSYPNAEDWGWFVEFSDDGHEYMICCSGSLEDEEYEWRVYVTQPKRLFRKSADGPAAPRMLQRIRLALEGAAIAVDQEEDPT
jgi:hypothetical protein